MFTGLIDHCGHILAIENIGDGRRFHIQTHYTDIASGESIAVNGVCLTVVERCLTNDTQTNAVQKNAIQTSAQQFTCDVSPETLKLTNAGHLKVGGSVNLERSLRLNDRLHGHFVMGHVDQTGIIRATTAYAGYTHYTIAGIAPESRSLLVKKGSIAVNGVSLTLNEITEDGFEVMLIPETLKRTNLRELTVGDIVNVEYDYLAKLLRNLSSRFLLC